MKKNYHEERNIDMKRAMLFLRRQKFLPPLSAFVVLFSGLWGCSSPVQLASDAESIAKIPSYTLAVMTDSGPLDLHYLGGDRDVDLPLHIFVHGTPGSARGWSDYLLDPLSHSRPVAIDRFGFGRSQPQSAVISLHTHAAAIGALLERIQSPAILIGHSLGGPVVVQAAINYPEKVAAIVIAAGSLDPQLEKPLYIQYVGQIWPFSILLPRALRNANAELIGLKNELVRLRTEFSRLTTPTVIIHGTADKLVPYANVAYMQEHFTHVPSLKIITLENRGHFLPWDSRADMNRAIRMAMQAAQK